jgi:uncharacterized protein with von Willebrand factor type A (vWA) domain
MKYTRAEEIDLIIKALQYEQTELLKSKEVYSGRILSVEMRARMDRVEKRVFDLGVSMEDYVKESNELFFLSK